MTWCSIEHNGLECRCWWRKTAYTFAQWSILLKEEKRGKLMVKKVGVLGSNATSAIVAGT
jgi:hypothetical protein